MSSFPRDILLVEDNPDDVDLTLQAFRGAASDTRLNIVDNGRDAVAYLRRVEPFSGVSRPNLILLDLNLPGMSGHEVLEVVKGDPDLRTIPVLVFTTSSSDVDIQRSYELGANGYVPKPIGIGEYEHVVKRIEGFWLDVAELPRA